MSSMSNTVNGRRHSKLAAIVMFRGTPCRLISLSVNNTTKTTFDFHFDSYQSVKQHEYTHKNIKVNVC